MPVDWSHKRMYEPCLSVIRLSGERVIDLDSESRCSVALSPHKGADVGGPFGMAVADTDRYR
jgi:hypothetical protein